LFPPNFRLGNILRAAAPAAATSPAPTNVLRPWSELIRLTALPAKVVTALSTCPSVISFSTPSTAERPLLPAFPAFRYVAIANPLAIPVTLGWGIVILLAIFLFPTLALRADERFLEPFERDLAAIYFAFEISLLSLKYIIRPFFALLARNTISVVKQLLLYILIPITNHIYTTILTKDIMSENLLGAYTATPSFALWDGESAVLRFTGNLDTKFTKVDSKGKEQIYLGIEVFLIEHSNENYSHRHDSVCILRTGNESTLAKWANDERGGIKKTNEKQVYKVSNSAKLGYDLRLENVS